MSQTLSRERCLTRDIEWGQERAHLEVDVSTRVDTVLLGDVDRSLVLVKPHTRVSPRRLPRDPGVRGRGRADGRGVGGRGGPRGLGAHARAGPRPEAAAELRGRAPRVRRDDGLGGDQGGKRVMFSHHSLERLL